MGPPPFLPFFIRLYAEGKVFDTMPLAALKAHHSVLLGVAVTHLPSTVGGDVCPLCCRFP